ncbi:MAG: MBL fold metallo-hydrolase [Thermoanaerobaculales bacterium]|jgi:metallo-beta-lactamase family protein|nr:MBL fold metallo-hydrolase [Thermoanaerobaculales bacterium]
MKLTVLGAGRCVTGSKYLLEWKHHAAMVDCGLFQGPAENRRKNWAKLPFPPKKIEQVILTHAHIDHSGWLPRLVRQGFKGPVFCTPPTRDLLRVLLPDAAHIQEEEARYANKKGYSKHAPALPLFRAADARAALKLLEPVDFDEWRPLHDGVRFRLHRQGHILGAAAVELETKVSGGGKKTVFFSGDVGRHGVPILREPEPYPGSDVLLVESTYGDRFHGGHDPRTDLAEAVQAGLRRGGIILIPAFAIDRTQELLYMLHELTVDGDLPEIPMFLDSPMGIEATALYSRSLGEHDIEMRQFFADSVNPIFPPNLKVTPSSSESRKLNRLKGPAIIISASGMATGGRILHHLKLRLPHEQNTVIFVGYQAVGTKGRRLVEGEPEVKIHGEWIPVKAHIAQISGLSAHADAGELTVWLSRREREPEAVYLIHGEYEAQQALAVRLQEQFGWKPEIPELGESFTI